MNAMERDTLKTLVDQARRTRIDAERRSERLDAPTPRQTEILQLIADEGLSDAEIAVRLGSTQVAVRDQLKRMYRRVAVTGRAHAVATGIRAGWIE